MCTKSSPEIKGIDSSKHYCRFLGRAEPEMAVWSRSWWRGWKSWIQEQRQGQDGAGAAFGVGRERQGGERRTGMSYRTELGMSCLGNKFRGKVSYW